MIELLPCRWREATGERMLCHSPRFIAPPNAIGAEQCLHCSYREDNRPASLELNAFFPRGGFADLASRRRTDLPPLFCITCLQTPQRTALASRHFREQNLDVQFFPGIHARTFGLRTVHEAYTNYRMPAGHVGLVLSHYMLWQTLLFLPFEEILILEDDAHFGPEFSDRFREAYAELPADWQFVFVGSFSTEGKPVRWISPRVGVLNYPYGTHAYLVKRSVLPFLLHTNHEARNHIDLQLMENSLPHLKFYAFLPSLVGQHSCDGNWPTTTSVSDDAPARAAISPTGYWLGLDKFGHHFDPVLAVALIELFKGTSVADLGCGEGKYVQCLTEAGVDCQGFDGNPATPLFNPACEVLDLSRAVHLSRCFDWILSLEVGEHIPAAFEDIFIDNLHRHNRKGIVLSWAIVGQGGHGHFNERDNDYIRQKLHSLGYYSNGEVEQHLRSVAGLPWFKNTLMVFMREPSSK